MALFPTKPEPVEVNLERSAIVVVDMQNAFATKGGMLDLSGMDIAPAQRVITVLKQVLDTCPSGRNAVEQHMPRGARVQH